MDYFIIQKEMRNIKKTVERRKLRDFVPVYFWVFLALFVISVLSLVLIHKNSAAAEFLNRTSGRAIRLVLTSISNVFPFSLTETLIVASPVLVAVVFGIMISKGKRGLHLATRFFCALLCVVFVIVSFFTFGYESSYYGATIEQNTGVERNKLSTEELASAAEILYSRAARELDHVIYLESGSSVLPYSFSRMNAKLNDAYARFCVKYPSYQLMYSNAKPVILSEPWTYTHISGLYSFFTGEANINVNYPDFIMVTSTAHEMSHQRGIGKEDEADFAAFLVCIESTDPYIRYCGYLEMYRNVLDRLYSAKVEEWSRLREAEDSRIRRDIDAFSVFFEKYRENVAAKVNDVINDTYIQSHNQPEGVKSYGLVVDLAVNYLLYTEQTEVK